jgi:hypothetical protein
MDTSSSITTPSTTSPSIIQNEASIQNPSFNSKDFIIFVLIFILFFAVLGINIFNIIGNLIQYFLTLVKPLLSLIGYTTGSVINTTTDLATDTTKFGIDVVGGTAKDVGNLFLAASDKNDIPNYVPAAKNYSSAIFNSIGTTLALHPELRDNPPNYLNKNAIPVSIPSLSPIISNSITPSHSPIISNSPNSTNVTINVPSADTHISPIQNPISSNKNKWCLIGEFQGKTGCVDIEDSNKCMSGQIFPSQQLCMNSKSS